MRVVWLVLTLGLLAVALGRFELLSEPMEGRLVASEFGVLYAGLGLLTMILFAHWFKWREIALKRPTWRIGYAVAGVLALQVPTMYRMAIFDDRIVTTCAVGIVICTAIGGRDLFPFLATLLPLKEKDLRMAFAQFPPRERLDLLPFDILVVAFLLLPLLVRLTHPLMR